MANESVKRAIMGVGILLIAPIAIAFVWYILIDVIIYILSLLGWVLFHLFNVVLNLLSIILNPVFIYVLHPIFYLLCLVGQFVLDVLSRIAIYFISNALALLALTLMLRTLPHWELANLSHWWHIRFPILLSSYLAYQGWSLGWGLLLCSYAVTLCSRHRDATERRARSIAYNIPLWGPSRVKKQTERDREYHGIYWGPGPESIMSPGEQETGHDVQSAQTQPTSAPTPSTAVVGQQEQKAAGGRLQAIKRNLLASAARVWTAFQSPVDGGKTQRLLKRAAEQKLSRSVWWPYGVELEGITGGVHTGTQRHTTATEAFWLDVLTALLRTSPSAAPGDRTPSPEKRAERLLGQLCLVLEHKVHIITCGLLAFGFGTFGAYFLGLPLAALAANLELLWLQQHHRRRDENAAAMSEAIRGPHPDDCEECRNVHETDVGRMLLGVDRERSPIHHSFVDAPLYSSPSLFTSHDPFLPLLTPSLQKSNCPTHFLFPFCRCARSCSPSLPRP